MIIKEKVKITGKRKIKKNFNPENEYVNLKKNIKNNGNIDIDLSNRVFMYIIENKTDTDVIGLFNQLKKYNNETTYSLMIRYYSKKNIDSAIELLDIMDDNNIKIKKRTVIPIFSKLCQKKDLDKAYQLFKNRMRKVYQLEEDDYQCILDLAFKKKNTDRINSFLKRNN